MPSGRRGTRKQDLFGGSEIRLLDDPFRGRRARGYARVSSLYQADSQDPIARDAEAISLPEQIEAIKRYCLKHGYEYSGCHWDIKPGSSAAREGLLQLCNAAKANDFDVVVIWRSNRLCRGARGATPLLRAWEHTHGSFRVESVTDDFDISMLPILGWAAGKAADDLRAHTMENRLARARRGEAVSGILPYWIKRDPLSRRPVLVPENVRQVIHAVEMYLAGETIVHIATWLRNNAPPHPTRKTAWNPRSVQNLLGHSALYGDLWYSKTFTVHVHDPASGNVIWVTRQKTTPDRTDRADSPTVTRMTPLIHKDAAERAGCSVRNCPACEHLFTYDDVEEQRKRRTRCRFGQPPMFLWPLKGIAFCGVCNTALSQTTQRHVYHRLPDGSYKKYPLRRPISLLRCQSQHIFNTTGRRCRENGYLRADWLLDAVKRMILQVCRNPDNLAQLAAGYLPQILSRSEPQANPQEVDRLTRRLQDKNQAMIALWLDKQAGQLDPDVFQVLNVNLREEKMAIQAELDAQETTSTRSNKERQSAIDIAAVADRLRQQGARDDNWHEAAVCLISRVDLMADRSIHYTWRVPGLDVQAQPPSNLPAHKARDSRTD